MYQSQSFDNFFNESYLNRKCVYVGTMNNKNFWSTFEITEKILPSKVVKNKLGQSSQE